MEFSLKKNKMRALSQRSIQLTRTNPNDEPLAKTHCGEFQDSTSGSQIIVSTVNGHSVY